MGPPLRLVLLGYTRPLPVQNNLVRVENIRPIARCDLLKHFRRYYAYKGWPEDESEFNAIVARYEPWLRTLFPPVAMPPPGAVDAALPEAPEWKMRTLAEVVLRDCDVLERYHAGTPTASGGNPAAGSAVAPGKSRKRIGGDR